jgi:hypothetical protein
MSIRVYDFSFARHAAPGSPLSAGLLGKSVALPARFIICSSAVQAKIDGKSPWSLYSDDGLPWLTLSFWNLETGPALWADIRQGTWKLLHQIERPQTHVWRHVCADIDSVAGNMTVSVDGRPAMTVSTKDLKKPPRNLQGKLKIGLTDSRAVDGGVRQFFGSVTNVNVFRQDGSKHVDTMSDHLCSQTGDLLAWPDWEMEWEGGEARAREAEEDTVCGPRPSTYRVMLPAETSWSQAVHSCSSLGTGQLSGVASPAVHRRQMAWALENMATCTRLWLPLSDRQEEGVFRNTYTGRIETSLPWRRGSPMGRRCKTTLQSLSPIREGMMTFRTVGTCAAPARLT